MAIDVPNKASVRTASVGLMRETWVGHQPREQRRRLAVAFALSLFLHTLIASLQFGIPGFGLPGLALPWAERRAHSEELTVRLAEVPAAPTPRGTDAGSEPVRGSQAGTRVELRSSMQAPPARSDVRRPARTADRRARAPEIHPRPAPEILAIPDARKGAFAVPPPPPAEQEQAPAVARSAPIEEPIDARNDEQATLAREESVRRAREQEAIRLEEAQAARNAALEARRQAEESARQQALAIARETREEQARQEQEQRQDEEKKQALAAKEEEARKQEEARAQRLALELQARRQAEEAERRRALALVRQAEEQQRAELVRQAQLQRTEQQKRAEEQKQAEAERRADEAAARQVQQLEARRNPAAAPQPGGPAAPRPSETAARAQEQSRPPGAPGGAPPPARPSTEPGDPSRRGSVIGRIERDVGLQMYVEGWRTKIERNSTLNYPASARSRSHDDPIVTVALRRDGSVEDVHINRSSGLPELDEAVRRMVRLYAPYSVFPPELARRYDVIEIRRVWSFREILAIGEEIR